jgi:hypothetical protein
VLLEQGPPDGLRGVRGEDEIDGLVLESVEDLVARFAELRDEALERLLDVGLGGRRGLVGEVSPLELDPPSVRDLHLLSEVGEVEHVREGAGDDDGVRRRQAGKLAPELDQPRLVPIVLVLRRELVALLNLHARRDKEIRHADLEDGRGWGGVRIRGGASRAGPGGRRGSGRRGARRTRRACRPRRPCRGPATAAARRWTGGAPSYPSWRNPTGSSARLTAQGLPQGLATAAGARVERGNGGDWSERGDGGEG